MNSKVNSTGRNLAAPAHPRISEVKDTLIQAPQNHLRGLRLLAIFEAFKGLLAVVAGLSLLHYMPGDLEDLAQMGNSIINHLHLDPNNHYPQVFLIALSQITSQNILWIAVIAFLYSMIRFAEAYGLWRSRAWAEWMAILSAGLYLPIEFFELIKEFSYVKLAITFINILIVVYLFYIRFWKNRVSKKLK